MIYITLNLCITLWFEGEALAAAAAAAPEPDAPEQAELPPLASGPRRRPRWQSPLGSRAGGTATGDVGRVSAPQSVRSTRCAPRSCLHCTVDHVCKRTSCSSAWFLHRYARVGNLCQCSMPIITYHSRGLLPLCCPCRTLREGWGDDVIGSLAASGSHAGVNGAAPRTVSKVCSCDGIHLEPQ